MKNWLRHRKTRHTAFDLEDALRAERPLPPAHLVKAITARLHHRPVRFRLGLGRAVVVAAGAAALLVGSSLAAGLGPAGGLHLSSVIHTFSGPPAKQSAPPPASAGDEYVGAPTITTFSPTSGLVGSAVTIGGTNFGGTTSVKFHGTSSTSFSVNSPTSITAAVPAGATTGTISVTNPGGTATSAGTFTVIQTPSITSFSPTFGPVGTSVTITGSNFTGTTTVKFGTKAATSFSVDSDTQITATVPTGATTGKITVTNPAGSDVSTDSYVVAGVVAPSDITFAPTSGKVTTPVTISGLHFTGTTAVLFNGQAASFTVSSDTKITTKVPAGATTGPITVTNGAGSTDSAADFSVIVTPSITSFTPTFGGTGQQVTITGSGFTGTSAVKFGTGTASFTVDSDTQITATVPATAKTGPITVTTASGSDVSSDTFTVATTPPTVTSFAPLLGAAGASVTITGTNLANTTEVDFGSVSASFVVNSATSVTATVPAVAPVAGGTNVKISVTTDIGATTSTKTFEVIQTPSITSFSPGAGTPGTTMVTINGSGFLGTGSTAGDFVKFNGTAAASFTVNSDTKITAKVALGTTTGTISVKNAAGTDTSTDSFVIPTAVPTITSFTPTHGAASAQGHTTVTITGTNLSGVTSVMFNGKASGTVTVTDDSHITAVTPPTGATTGPIKVTTPKGTATSATSFTVDAAPKVTTFTPLQGAVGDSVTISGTNLSDVTGVSFNGTASLSVSGVTATSVTATVPVGATSGKITVSDAAGETSTTAASFFVVQSPVITSFSPGSGLAGTMVTINGTGFLATGKTAGDFVKFNGTAATSFTVNSDTKITAKVAPGTTTGTISVKNAAGTGTSAASFVVPAAAPTITSFTPTHGAASAQGHTLVTITGTNLSGVTSVMFNGKASGTVSVTDDSHITALTPPTGGTTGPIKVTTPAGTVTSATSFTVDAAPKVTTFTPTFGPAGASVTISGTNLSTVTGVSFNGTASLSVSGVTATSVTATVPAGATTGKITVSNPAGETATTATTFQVIASPTITSFTPGSGVAGTMVTINGTGFLGTGKTAGDFVQFNGTAATSFTVVSDTKITAKVAPATTTGAISVKNAGGTATSLGDFIVTTAAPTITSFTPTHGAASAQGHTTVVITGTNFRGATSVLFNGKAASSVSIDSDTQITAVTPLTGATTGPIKITTPSGLATSSTPFTVDAAPKVTTFTPLQGAAATSVTISGTNLSNVTDVSFNGTPSLSVSGVTATSVTATVPAGATTGKITVSDAAGETSTTTGVFTVIAVPTISSFSPGSGKTGALVTINGTGFTGTGKTAGDFVKFGGLAGTTATFTVVSDIKMTAKVPATLAAGSYTIAIQNGAGNVVSAGSFVVTTATPTITSFTPTDGPGSADAQSAVTITGTHLDGVTSVTFNGKAASSVSVTDDSHITAVTPLTGATTGTIKVTTPSGIATSATSFVVDPGPKITTITASGNVGDTLRITGSGFLTKFNGASIDTDTSVFLNGVDDTADISGITDTQITVTVPDGASTGPVTVTNGHGESATSAGVFTVTVPPSITSFTPSHGAIGSTVTITGSHFSGTTAVAFNGTNATTFSVDSDTQITATVPAAATTGKITVTRPSGTAQSATNFSIP